MKYHIFAFSTSSNLKSHQIHTKEKLFVSDNCKKAFSGNGDLKRHMEIHTKGKPYVCEILSEGIFSKGLL
ncbi:UNVERIFIED_CONTAM: zinc finger protein [Trichonephila clavipes]